MQYDGQVAFPVTNACVNVMNTAKTAIGFAQGDDGLALTVWLHKDALIARLDGMIAATASPDALTPEDKQQRIAELQGELLLVERQEVEAVIRAQNEGLNADHRGDVNYLAFLGCMLATTPHADPSPGTSPQYAYDVVSGTR